MFGREAVKLVVLLCLPRSSIVAAASISVPIPSVPPKTSEFFSVWNECPSASGSSCLRVGRWSGLGFPSPPPGVRGRASLLPLGEAKLKVRSAVRPRDRLPLLLTEVENPASDSSNSPSSVLPRFRFRRVEEKTQSFFSRRQRAQGGSWGLSLVVS